MKVNLEAAREEEEENEKEQDKELPWEKQVE